MTELIMQELGRDHFSSYILEGNPKNDDTVLD